MTLLILNPTPNSRTSLWIPKPHFEFKNITLNSQKLTPNSKTSLRFEKSHFEFLNLTPNSKTSLRIQKHHSELKKTHSEFKNIAPNSNTSLRIRKTHSEFEKLTPNSSTGQYKTWTTDHGLQTTDGVYHTRSIAKKEKEYTESQEIDKLYEFSNDSSRDRTICPAGYLYVR